MNLRDLASEGWGAGSEPCAGKVEPVRVTAPTLTLSLRMTIPRPAKPIDRDFHPEDEPYLFPKDRNHRFTERASPAAVAKVDAIREQALALGWSERRLYQNRGQFRFPYGEDYSLVCFIGDAQRIGAVTKEYIEIVGPPPRENRLRFYNPDVPQPWRVVRLSPSATGRGLSLTTEKSSRAPGRS